MSKDAITAAIAENKRGDADVANAKLFSLVYFTRPDILAVAKEAYLAFFSENALNPMAFPSLAKMESDVVSMALDLLHAPEGASGSMSSGGSESLLLAIKTARDWARAEKPNVKEPEILLPVTAHPASLKAAHLVGLRPVLFPVTPDLRADVAKARALVTDNTILIVCSAPQYPHGVVDPVTELAAIADERGILCHVDACIGGFFLPWVEKLGRPVPAWDFRVKGVTSISADLHKYAYAAKGASVVLYRTKALRRHQFFVHGDWPGGLFGSPSILGTRAGGPIAAAWAVMNYLGEEGYLDLAKRALEASDRIRRGIDAIPGLRVLGEPVMSLVSFGTTQGIDVYVLGDMMQEKGWRLDRQQNPPSLHLTVSPAHDAVVEPLLADLRVCVAALTAKPIEPTGAAAMYGMLGALPDRMAVKDALLEFMDGFTS
jgi:glutamate/tyrosine decarboxylase-like PLP-dependent enzyme